MEDNLLDEIIWDTEDDGAAGAGGTVDNAGTAAVGSAGVGGTTTVSPTATGTASTGAQNSADAAKAAAERAQVNAERLNTLGQNVTAAQGKVGDAVNNMNNIAAGKVNGMADILAQYGPKETAEQMEARKRKERNTGNILAMLNMLQGVANVVTASSGNTGRYAGSVDVVKPFQQGIMAAETERKANDVAREKARQAYIDKALSRAKIDYDAAQKDLGAARAAEEAERKRQATEYEKAEQRRHDMEKTLIASNNLDKKLDQNERFHMDDVKYKNKSLGLKQQALEVAKAKAANSGSGKGTGKNGEYDTFFYGGGTDKKIEINKAYWSKDKGGARKSIANVIEQQQGGKEYIDQFLANHDKNYVTELKPEEFNDLVKDYIFDEGDDSPVIKALYDIARIKEEDRPKADFFGDEGGSKSGNSKLLF